MNRTDRALPAAPKPWSQVTTLTAWERIRPFVRNRLALPATRDRSDTRRPITLAGANARRGGNQPRRRLVTVRRISGARGGQGEPGSESISGSVEGTERMKMIECYRGVVHPWLCDAMGHMTTRHYVGMFDDAGYHLLAALGFATRHLDEGIGFADVRHVISYKAELRAGALLLIRCGVTRVGERSLTALYRMEALESGAVAAEMEVVMVQFDLKRRQAIAVIPEIRIQAEAFLAEG